MIASTFILTRRIAALALGAVVALMSPVQALTPLSPCEIDAYGMSSGEWVGWDNGHVLASYYWRGELPADEDWKTTALVRLIDCQSGDFVLISRPSWQEDRYNLRQEHQGVLDQIASGEPLTLAQFSRKMKRAGAQVSRYSDTEETCSCSLYFPELRGNKTPFRGTDG